MTRKTINTLCSAVVSLVLCSVLGCVNMGHRFYSGPALAKSEMAIVYADSGCRIQTIKAENEKEEKALGIIPQGMLELLPGIYNVAIQYGRVDNGYRTTTITTGARIQRKIAVQAGNIYIIYAEVRGANLPYYLQDTPDKRRTWRPVIVNLNEYNKEECEKSSGGRCFDKDSIGKRTEKYLQGERRIMSFHPADAPFTYDIDKEARVFHGFWW